MAVAATLLQFSVDTVIHAGQIVKLTSFEGMTYIVPPGRRHPHVGPFLIGERELALEVAACHFSHGEAPARLEDL